MSRIAFSWRTDTLEKTTKIIENDGGVFQKDTDLSDDEDYRSLRLNIDSLQAYSRRPDCFKKATNTIRIHCAALEMDEDARVNAAISMTLCEIATAKHHSLPMECLHYSLDTAYSAPTPSSHSSGGCVDALARSAQFWSSYSGYLREAPQLCHAFRRWNDIDLARDIYYNATVENIALTRFVINREKKAERVAAEWMKQTTEIQNVGVELRSVTQGFSSDMNSFFLQLSDGLNETVRKFWETNRQLHSSHDVSRDRSIALFGVALDDVLYRYSTGLSTALDSLEPILASRLDGLFLRHENQYQQLDRFFSAFQMRWIEFAQNLNGMKQDLLEVAEYAAQTSSTLSLSLRDANDLRDIQYEASLAAGRLVNSVVQLTDVAHTEFESINGSAYLIKQYLQERQEKDEFWKVWFMRILSLVYRVDQSSLAYLNLDGVYSGRVILSIFGFTWMAFRTFLSAITTMSIILCLMTMKFFKKRSEHLIASALYCPTPPSPGPMKGDPKLQNGLIFKETSDLRRNRGNAPLITVLGPHRPDRGYANARRRISRIPDRLYLTRSGSEDML